jgi:hypothetical protein
MGILRKSILRRTAPVERELDTECGAERESAARARGILTPEFQPMAVVLLYIASSRIARW